MESRDLTMPASCRSCGKSSRTIANCRTPARSTFTERGKSKDSFASLDIGSIAFLVAIWPKLVLAWKESTLIIFLSVSTVTEKMRSAFGSEAVICCGEVILKRSTLDEPVAIILFFLPEIWPLLMRRPAILYWPISMNWPSSDCSLVKSISAL